MENILTSSILMSDTSGISLTPVKFILCTLVSLALGLVIAAVFMIRNSYNKDFVIALILLPAIVQVIIMLVNGNLGTGVAVAGAFSLIRFRSTPGTAKEIVNLFMSMAVGLATGMGYVGYAVLFVIVLSCANLIIAGSGLGKQTAKSKLLRITVPDTVNYKDRFEEVFAKYTLRHEITRIKTANSGSNYKLEYMVELKADANEKDMIDELRSLNDNQEIILSYPNQEK